MQDHALQPSVQEDYPKALATRHPFEAKQIIPQFRYAFYSELSYVILKKTWNSEFSLLYAKSRGEG